MAFLLSAFDLDSLTHSLTSVGGGCWFMGIFSDSMALSLSLFRRYRLFKSAESFLTLVKLNPQKYESDECV